MKRNLNFILLLLSEFFIFNCLESCSRKLPQDQGDNYIFRGLSIYYIDSITNASLIGHSGQRFNADSVKILKKENDTAEFIGSPFVDSTGTYSCNFEYLYQPATTEQDILSFQFNFTFYIYLNYLNIDTIMISKNPNADIRVLSQGKLIDSTAPISGKQIEYITEKR